MKFVLLQYGGAEFLPIIVPSIVVILVIITAVGILKRYRRCPSDKILVIYGKIGGNKSARCIHGGAAFILPVFQYYQFLDLTPMSIEVNLANALSKQNIRIDVPSRFTVGVSTKQNIMTNAAERLLGLNLTQVQELAKDIIFGQLRLVIATMDIEEINSDRDKFLENVAKNVEAELNKIGLQLINVNVTDIRDESGYIEALGKEAAAKAVNDAKKSVAEKDRDGAIGESNARKDQRIEVSKANATAIEGENEAKVSVANSEAIRREKEAEAKKRATAAEKVQSALALQEAYAAEGDAEKARADREKATREADVIVPAQIEAKKVEIDAEASAERERRKAKGDADGTLFKMQAQAQGIFEILSKQAEGFNKIVESANGNTKDAVLLMIVDKLNELVKTQVEAVKGIKIDKVTVWDSLGAGKNGDSPATANFLSGMLKSVPPLEDLFKMAGMDLPKFLGSSEKKEEVVETEKVEEAAE